MSRKVLVILFAFVMLTVKAQESDFNIQEFYPIDKSHSYIGFSVKYMGFAMVRGRFEKFNGTFKYNEKDISKTSISLSIDVSSIDTDHERRDKDLKSENWFDVEKFSEITFVSKEVRSTNSGFEIIGNLTIKGVTKEVVIKMNEASGVLKDVRGDSQVILSGETTINRTDFGVEGKRWSAVKEGITGVADEVRIEVSILGKQTNKRNFRNRYIQNESMPSGKLYKTITENGLEAGFKVFEEMRNDSESKLNPFSLHNAGFMLLKEGKIKQALEVLKKNIETFSNESNLNNYYAEALAVSGDLTTAKIYYKKALELNANNLNASEILRHLN
jgi:polyisoprenoid-binding protein YceI